MLQLTKVQVDILLDKFVSLDTDGDGIVLLPELFIALVRFCFLQRYP